MLASRQAALRPDPSAEHCVLVWSSRLSSGLSSSRLVGLHLLTTALLLYLLSTRYPFAPPPSRPLKVLVEHNIRREKFVH